MTRGNQRERDRAKAQKAQAGKASKNTKSGAEMLRDKDTVAAIMREKQQRGNTHLELATSTTKALASYG
ncbi:Similar to conserved hypothetical protein [Penicillium marneffei ATCC 18224]; acc. no. XP_002144436 [Pyronema omphalodes CBS 100304]|uniref:Small EDRK-rich factor-like N-terminal domain-containing protein n=1 Tax=Pyronema omphalodes (strain CBS 100304) TaxID=1076935 RepID=U4L1G5_PYROM|nr:Similar to conserved hypothetical protein [Penicillium marneffei ATCC 18224]; acc. no. XP_002144436 [Pyronema omphalodes CBS 100304]